MNEIIPVLLAGGSGQRLWPLSRQTYPKQFLRIIEDVSLFQQSALRSMSSTKINFKPHITLTHSDFRFFIGEQLLEVGIDPGPILIEPDSKNTAPAILAATLFASNKNNDPIILVTPSDHLIPNIQKFHDSIEIGIKEVKKGNIVTFGIFPTHPETGYGYIEFEDKNLSKVMKIKNFIEKPNKKKAKEMISKGNYLWNSGIFLFRARDMIKAFEQFAPDILFTMQKTLKNSKIDLGFIRLDQQSWSKCKNISIDYAIMEKVNNLSVIPFSESWSDLGDWNTVWNEMKPDKNNVSLSTNAHYLKCQNTLLRSENHNQIIVGLGLKNVIAVAMQDAVLVANKNMTQNIKDVVKELSLKHVSQAKVSQKDHRPWGGFEILSKSDGFQIKKLSINPGALLSLQSHIHRSEHWIVLKGYVQVTINKKIKKLCEGESVFIPKGSIHRIENISKLKTIIIEIQVGDIIDEDDIIRYEDLYSRT